MKTDRTTRMLTALQRSGSTSRVLNLLAVEREHGGEEEYRTAPLFRDPVLNSCVIVKHRLRLDELYLFDTGKATVTKLIIPFDKADLRLGGRAVLVGQKGWRQALRAECRHGERLDEDLDLLELIDRLPSLDPFLLREQLRRYGRTPARFYFAISPGDVAKMSRYAAVQIEQLVARAFAEQGLARTDAAVKLVEALLAREADEKLEPLRATLRLEGDAFAEGVFSWRGFLYYKWALSHLWPQLDDVSRDMGELVVSGSAEARSLRHLEESRRRLQRGLVDQRLSVCRTLGVYDHAFNELSRNGRPEAFVDFLERAPGLFLELGEKVGVIAHIASYWRYRFPPGKPLRVQIEEILDIMLDFESGLECAALAA